MEKIFQKKTIKLIFISLLFYLISSTSFANQKKIALTFDDGPNPPYTNQILETLQKNGAHATFFVMGINVKAHPEILKQVYAAGNEIGNHTFSHPLITKISTKSLENELNKTNQLIYSTINVYPKLFRPPYGMSSASTTKVIEQLGYKKITWDFMVGDYQSNITSEKIAADVIKHARSGAIITMHDKEKTAQALPKIINTLKNEGFEFVTVSQLGNIKPYQ